MHYTLIGLDPKGKRRTLTAGGQPCWGLLSVYARGPGYTLQEVYWRPEFTPGFHKNRSKAERIADFKELFEAMFKGLSELKYTFLTKSNCYPEDFHVHIEFGNSLVQDTMCRLFLIRNTVEYAASAMYHKFKDMGYPTRTAMMAADLMGTTRSFGVEGVFGYFLNGDECIHHRTTHVVDVRYFVRTGKLYCQDDKIRFSDGKGGYQQAGKIVRCMTRPKVSPAQTLEEAFRPLNKQLMAECREKGLSAPSEYRCKESDIYSFIEHLFGPPPKK